MDYETCLATDPHLAEDDISPQGHMISGWRLVRPGGWVQAYTQFWQADALQAFVGQRVWLGHGVSGEGIDVFSQRYVETSRLCYIAKPQTKADYRAAQQARKRAKR